MQWFDIAGIHQGSNAIKVATRLVKRAMCMLFHANAERMFGFSNQGLCPPGHLKSSPALHAPVRHPL